MSIDELSTLLQISKRTVFREVQDIDYILKPFGLVLASKPKKGLYLQGSEEQKAALRKSLYMDTVHYQSKEERRKLLIFEILKINQIQKLHHYADVFQVSKATISNDLEVIETWFQAYDLSLNRTPGLGVELLGDEQNYRRALTAILADSIYDRKEDAINIYDPNLLLEQVFEESETGILSLLNQIILKQVLQVFKEQEQPLGLHRYAQSSYIGLIIHVTIAIDRILKHEAIANNDFIIDMMINDASFQQAEKISKHLETTFSIVIPKVETAFIAMHIKGAKLAHNHFDEEPFSMMMDQEELVTLSSDMIATLPPPYDDLLKDDDELLQGLMAHLRPTLVRLHHHMPIYNPLLAQLQQLHQETYALAKTASICIEHAYEYMVPADEVGYLAMHFGAAIERLKRKDIVSRVIDVGIVCSSGIGVSAMLLARLKKVCDPFVHFETLSVEDILQQRVPCDLLVSTFTFAATEELIVVNPLLPAHEVQIVQDCIARKRREGKHKENQMMNPPIVEGSSDAVFALLDTMELVWCDDCFDCAQLIAYVSEYVAQSEVEQTYLCKLLKEREAVNSTIFKEMGFGLFHGVNPHINTCVLKIFRAKKPFKHRELQGVKFMVAMFMPKQYTQIQKQLMSLMSRTLIEDDQLFSAFAQADFTTIYAVVERLMKDFLFTHLQAERQQDVP